MKYTKEQTEKLVADYTCGVSVYDLASGLGVQERSVIAKLSTLGVYKKKVYTTKRGEVPVKKSEHIANIAALLDVQQDILESLEKCNKNVLVLIETQLRKNAEET